MSSLNRIILNIIVSYGREIIAVLCGIFTSRWMLEILGIKVYGLVGVICGMMTFMTFFNNFFAGAIARYFGISVGFTKIAGKEKEGLEECRRWFNMALLIHSIVPLILIVIGYPIGIWAIRNWLVIPPEHVEDCVFLFHFVCISCFIGMVNIPFSAMYIAKQRIAELTIYSIIGSLYNVGILYWMVTHPDNWIRPYFVLSYGQGILFQLIICVRAAITFPECKFVKAYLWDGKRFFELLKFSGIQLFGNLGELLRTQGLNLLINKMFGPTMNATTGLAGTVSGHSTKLEGALMTSMAPVINNLAGAKDYKKMLEMTYRSCRISLFFALILILPLSIELKAVLTLWLKTLPDLLVPATYLTFAIAVVMTTTRGVGIAVTAVGKIVKYYIFLGSTNMLLIPILWCIISLCDAGYLFVFYIMLAIKITTCTWSVFIAKQLIGFSPVVWFKRCLFPVFTVATITLAAAFSVKYFCHWNDIARILTLCPLTGIIFLTLSYFFVLKENEKKLIQEKIPFLSKKRV